MASYYELVKQAVVEGLRRANYDVTRFQPAPIKAGLFADRAEIMAADHSARTVAQMIKTDVAKGKISTREELEKQIDYLAAYFAYGHSTIAIRIFMRSGENVSKHVQEAREALKIMERTSKDQGSVDYHQREFKKLIGEE